MKPWQKKVIASVVSEQKLASFYLSGGTALAAYYLSHRISEDLDFFIFEDPDILFLHQFAQRLKGELGAKEVRYEKLHDRSQFFFAMDPGEVKVEFSKYPFRQLEETSKRDGISIDSLRDIAANKLMAMLDRFDPKDFVDIFFILRQMKFNEVRADGEKKFGIKIGDVFLGGEIAKVRRIEALPKMVKPLPIKELKDFFANLAKDFESNIFQ